jgi:O-antigen biosynthesis protein WbqP
MKRTIEILIGLSLLVFLAIPLLIIAIAICATSKGAPLYWSERVGKNNKIFRMPKFRSMQINTPELATHLLENADSYVSPIGAFLRRTSLDELPQLISVIKGDMSFVGPRPALFNQNDLIELRIHFGVDKLKPGITGWAQINGRDQVSINEKVALDVEYMKKKSLWFDIKISYITLIKTFKNIDIAH